VEERSGEGGRVISRGVAEAIADAARERRRADDLAARLGRLEAFIASNHAYPVNA